MSHEDPILKKMVRNKTFLHKYLTGEIKIDPRLVTKFVNEFQPRNSNKTVFRAEVVDRKVTGRRRVISSSNSQKAAAMGCVSMVKHRAIRTNKEINVNDIKISIFEIKKPKVFLFYEELIDFYHSDCVDSFIDLDHLESELENLIVPPEKKKLVNILDLSHIDNAEIFFYE